MALFSPTAGASGREDYAALLASPAGFLASPALGAGLFASPAPAKGAAVKEGRLSFDVLQLEADESAESSQEGVLEAMGAPSQIKGEPQPATAPCSWLLVGLGPRPASKRGGRRRETPASPLRHHPRIWRICEGQRPPNPSPAPASELPYVAHLLFPTCSCPFCFPLPPGALCAGARRAPKVG